MSTEKRKLPQNITQPQQFDNGDKRYLFLVVMGLVTLLATFIVIIYYLNVEMKTIHSGKIIAPDNSSGIQLSPLPEISVSP